MSLDRFMQDTKVLERAIEDRDLYRSLILYVIDQLAEHHDINDSGGPNWAMSLTNDLKEALYGPGGW